MRGSARAHRDRLEFAPGGLDPSRPCLRLAPASAGTSATERRGLRAARSRGSHPSWMRARVIEAPAHAGGRTVGGRRAGAVSSMPAISASRSSAWLIETLLPPPRLRGRRARRAGCEDRAVDRVRHVREVAGLLAVAVDVEDAAVVHRLHRLRAASGRGASAARTPRSTAAGPPARGSSSSRRTRGARPRAW